MKRLTWFLALLIFGSSAPTWASEFHYLTGAGSSDPTAPITAAGFTPVALSDLTAADLIGVSVLWITNGDNGAPPMAVTDNIVSLSDWVFGGGVLSYHDRYVAQGTPNMADILPGATGVSFVSAFSSEIDILDGSTVVTAGLNNGSLDGGNFSNHGYADATTLPVGAVAILGNGVTDQIVDFYYAFGAGWVYYSTIPLDFYLAGGGNNPPADDFRNIYAVNEARFQGSLAGLTRSVPAPATLGLLGAGLIGLAAVRRKQAA